MSEELIEGVFCTEDSPDKKYILEIEVLKNKGGGENIKLEYPTTEKILNFSQGALDEIAKLTFSESQYRNDESVFGFSYNVLEV